MLSTRMKLTAGLSLVFAGALALSACSMGGAADENDTGSSDAGNSSAPTEEESSAPETEMDPAANLVGPGCEGYAEQVPEGDGSIQGMSQDPVAVAASNNPLLTTLVTAVSGELNPDVNLVDTLNGDEFTVFAPVNDAFAKIDAATMETLKTDSALLESILSYHVVPGQTEPADIEGTHTTVQGEDLEVTGSGDEWTVNGESMVICGGVQTANAVVYLVDTVLMPPME